ncbi:MAG: hypothetical protein Kow0037_05590 [Calditrichia bacterium]
MKSVFLYLFMGIILIVPSLALSQLSTCGNVYNLLNTWEGRDNGPGQAVKRQFDIAADLGLAYQYGERWYAAAQFQYANGGNLLGFVGENELEVDIHGKLNFKPNWSLKMGVFDLPFGGEHCGFLGGEESVTSGIMLNSLLYEALAFGAHVGSVTNLGMLLQVKSAIGFVEAGMFNGMLEGDENSDQEFSWILRYNSPLLANTLQFAFSGLYSKDSTHYAANATHTHFSAILLESGIPFWRKWAASAYWGYLFYSDNNPATQDRVEVMKLELSRQFSEAVFSLRYSLWRPEGSGTATHPHIPAIGFMRSGGQSWGENYWKVQRWQAGLQYHLGGNVHLLLEAFLDDFDSGSRMVYGSVSGIVLSL